MPKRKHAYQAAKRLDEVLLAKQSCSNAKHYFLLLRTPPPSLTRLRAAKNCISFETPILW